MQKMKAVALVMRMHLIDQFNSHVYRRKNVQSYSHAVNESHKCH